MRLLFDQNLSHRLVSLLSAEYPGSEHVRDAGLNSADDRTIWEYASQKGLIIVPKNSDFQQRALLYGHPPKVVWVRLGNCSTASVLTLLRARQSDVAMFAADPMESFLVMS